MRDVIKKFVSDERGLETVEYAIITGLIVAGTIAIIASIGGWVKGQFTGLDTELASSAAPPPGG